MAFYVVTTMDQGDVAATTLLDRRRNNPMITTRPSSFDEIENTISAHALHDAFGGGDVTDADGVFMRFFDEE